MGLRRCLFVFTLAGALSIGAICGSSDSGPELPESEPFPPDLAERLHTIRDSVAELRGMKTNPDVTEGTITREQLRAYYDEVQGSVTEDDRGELDALNTVMRLLHMIGPDDDAFEEFAESDADGILGFYVAEEDELVFVGDPSQMTPDDEFVLAHEYVHSFVDATVDEDAIADLVEDEEDDKDARTEYATTASCVEEGDASLAAVMYGYQAYGDAFFEDEETDVPPGSEPEPDTPPAIERYQSFNYNECVKFVSELYGENRDWDKIDRLYDRLPTTTEQILHLEKYNAKEGTTTLARPDLSERLGDDWELWDGGIFGEFDVYNYLASITNDEFGASIAAAGWGVGWMNIYSTDPADGESADVIVHLALEFDSMQDFDEFGSVYGNVLDIVSANNYTVGENLRPVCWGTADEFGYVSFGDGVPRWDIIIATTADARDAAANGRLPSGEGRACA